MESCVIILDNSEWNRNGDYFPTRLDAQKDAASLIFDAKIRSNIENCVGLMLMAGSQVKVLVAPTSERPKYESALFGPEASRIEGHSNCINAIQVAQLALKHRTNKNQAQRIILFLGSPPIGASETDQLQQDLAALGKQMKKNGVAIDLVLFGDAESVVGIFNAFLDSVNSSSGSSSHILLVSPGKSLREAVGASEIVRSAGAGDAEMGGGFDAEADPELAMAIRLSLEQQTRDSGAAAEAEAEQPRTAEEEELMQAIAMSLEESGNGRGNERGNE